MQKVSNETTEAAGNRGTICSEWCTVCGRSSAYIEQSFVLAGAQGDGGGLKEIRVETAVHDFAAPFKQRVQRA
jgi:hypothetical protein